MSEDFGDFGLTSSFYSLLRMFGFVVFGLLGSDGSVGCKYPFFG